MLFEGTDVSIEDDTDVYQLQEGETVEVSLNKDEINDDSTNNNNDTIIEDDVVDQDEENLGLFE